MQIRLLSIRRYRGVESLDWRPKPGVNCLIGPGDTGKSTILSAIALLLAPYPLGACSEFDFYRRRLAAGFEIEAYLGDLNLEAIGREHRIPHLHGWQDDRPVRLPEGGAEAVLRCRVRGTSDLELVYELPADGLDPAPPFSAALRRRLMLARLAGEERATRDLRLGPGSLLDRHLKTTDMRSPVHTAIAGATVQMQIPESAQAALAAIQEAFRREGLPTDLHLGLVPTQGAALVGMVALTEGGTPAEAIPITHAGAGTRQLALFSLSAALVGSAPILVLDEPERGLEPYRQKSITRRLVELCNTAGQAFLTTHSPAVLGSLPAGSVCRMRAGQAPVRFEGTALSALFRKHPEAFFARLPILCEGPTEMGLLDELLPDWLGQQPETLGVELVDGGGQPNILSILDQFIAAGLRCGAVLDNEHVHPGRRDRIRPHVTHLIWEQAINIEDAVCKWLTVSQLFDLIATASEARGMGLRYLEDQLYEAISQNLRQGTARELRTAGYADEVLRPAFYAAMEGNSWFKTREAGRILAQALVRIGIPEVLSRQLDRFRDQLRATLL
jgi:putative ATP-dependent endonuclease of the OLD family